MTFDKLYRDKTVMVTGHTGFKGSWLTQWLCMMGARVVGFSLPPDPAADPCYTTPSHFDELGLRDQVAAHIEGDVTDRACVEEAIRTHQPDFIFHLAAQPLVLRAYEEPHATVETNVMGTLNLLEAVRRAQQPCVMVMITTDKVYNNVGWLHSYREPDPLGGHDLYSASKACAELVISSYWRSFFEPDAHTPEGCRIAVAPARGGNVIGGGDWADDRIVPDAMRARAAGEALGVRNRHATRPWQHVLELLGGYLQLGQEVYQRRRALTAAAAPDRPAAIDQLREVCSPFNFGPFITSNQSVGRLVEEIFKHWPGDMLDHSAPDAPAEAGKLNLTIDKAYHILGWQPCWNFEETIQQTVAWYRSFYESAQGNPAAVRDLTQAQIRAYTDTCRNPLN